MNCSVLQNSNCSIVLTNPVQATLINIKMYFGHLYCTYERCCIHTMNVTAVKYILHESEKKPCIFNRTFVRISLTGSVSTWEVETDPVGVLSIAYRLWRHLSLCTDRLGQIRISAERQLSCWALDNLLLIISSVGNNSRCVTLGNVIKNWRDLSQPQKKWLFKILTKIWLSFHYVDVMNKTFLIHTSPVKNHILFCPQYNW